MKLAIDTVRDTFHRALKAHGMSDDQAASAAGMFLDAELAGKTRHGARHLLSYLDALDEGRINGAARPTAEERGSVLAIDADQGLAQFALEQLREDFARIVTQQGVAVAAVHNTFTTGELGWYSRFFSRQGFISATTTNAPALVALSETGERVVGTNPFTFGVPGAMTVDQAATPAAFMKVSELAERGEPLPEGWGVDQDGEPTTDARAVVERGALLPNGGRRGGNLALISELLAVLVGGETSLAAATKGKASPQVGLFCLALNPQSFGEDALDRVRDHLAQLNCSHGVYIPGAPRPELEQLEIDDATWDTLISRS